MCQIREVGGKYQVDGDMSPEDVLALAKIVTDKANQSSIVLGESSGLVDYMLAKQKEVKYEVFLLACCFLVTSMTAMFFSMICYKS